MFNALDYLNGWQLILVLAPVVFVMWLVRFREERAASISWQTMNKLQKGWVFLTLLTPGLSAGVLNRLSEEERGRILEAGGALSGSPSRVALPVLEAFFQSHGQKGAPSKDVQEVCRFLNLRYEQSPTELLAAYRNAYL